MIDVALVAVLVHVRLILARVLELMAAEGVRRLWLEVRLSNEAAQALYLANGFAPAGRRIGYYRAPVEDALVLRRDLPPAASSRPPVR